MKQSSKNSEDSRINCKKEKQSVYGDTGFIGFLC